MDTKKAITLHGVRQNNLKSITVNFPARKITVITGISGSGKSSLAFDTLYAEGQRRYIESLSTYTRQFLEKMPKPDLDSIENIPPAIALEQKNHVLNSRSTVGTQTEIVDYLRVLYAKIGRTECVSCGKEVRNIDTDSILNWALDWLQGRKILIVAPFSTAPATGKTKRKVSKESILAILREQGFRRVLLRHQTKAPQLLDLEEIKPSNLNTGELLVVVDRLNVVSTTDDETRTRVRESIEQALSLGQGNIEFVDMATWETRSFRKLFACIACGREHRLPEPQLFSFNSPLGACSRCSGFGHTLELDEALIVPDPSKTIKNGAIDPFSKPSAADWQDGMFRFADRHGISVGKRYRELTPNERKLLWHGDPKDKTFPGIVGCFEELKRWKYKLHVRVFIRRYQSQELCPDCKGARLTPESLAVKIGGYSIAETLDLPIKNSLSHFRSLKLTETEKAIAAEALSQIERRLSFLNEVGVGYLTLSRLAKTLSGGESQRINLATQLGNGLCGTLYVLDEPSIGLHAADTDRLIKVLKNLRDQGNSVVVVEHDLEVMRHADHLVELGPGAGRRGGELLAAGNAAELAQVPGSITGKYLSGAFSIPRSRPLRDFGSRTLRLVGCREHNLKDLTVEIPLNRFVVVTGVSGSGKSTLVHKTLYNALGRIFQSPQNTKEQAGRFERLYGAEQLNGVVLLDQSPIGRNSRSNPATYMKAWDEVRRIYANQTLSLRRGYTPQHFSFNVDGGRCPVCKGEGEITLDMHFMAEVKLPCEECDGKRFKKRVLDVAYRGKDVNRLLHTTIDEAFELFRDNSILVRKLGILRDVGLGYLELGQSATTLSGGESQRLKIASTLDDKQAENMLYIFDEPTTGLHLEDIKKLLGVLQDLVDARHSVLLIEHHLDVIAQADWVIDLGPGGGNEGGNLIAAGTPKDLTNNPASVTGAMLLKQGYQFPASERYS